MRTLPGLLLAFALLLTVSPVHAQSGRGLVRGYITFQGVAQDDLASKRLAATVTLRMRGVQGGKEHMTLTDERGSFEISDVRAGEYTITISAPGYTPWKLDIYVPSDFQWSMAVILKQGRKARGR